MAKTENYVAVLPDGTEYFGEAMDHYELGQLAREAVREKGLRCNRKKPESIQVKVFRLSIVKGQITRHQTNTVPVDIPLEPMTMPEYNVASDEAVASLPEEFRGPVQRAAWAEGHSNGYEEVIHHAEEMADWLEPAIAAYTKRITAKKAKAN